MKHQPFFDNRTGINTALAEYRDFLYSLHRGTFNDSAMLRVSGLFGVPATRPAEARSSTLHTGVPRRALINGGFPIAIAFKNREREKLYESIANKFPIAIAFKNYSLNPGTQNFIQVSHRHSV